MPNRFSEIAKDSANKTNAELRDELARVLPITSAEVQKYLPKKADKEKLAELMAIVDSSTAHNKKVKALLDSIDSLAGVVVRVLRAVAR